MKLIALHKLLKFGALAASFCISVSAHAADAESSANTTFDLEGSNWQLIKMTVLGGYVFEPEDPGKYVLNFRSDNRLTGSSDCNELGGLWHQDESRLSFDPFLSSRKLCAPGSLHNNVVLYLRNTTGFKIADGKMLISTPTEGVELIFEAR